MHKTAEYGIAAHWKYKESSDGKVPVGKSEEEKLNWLRQKEVCGSVVQAAFPVSAPFLYREWRQKVRKQQ